LEAKVFGTVWYYRERGRERERERKRTREIGEERENLERG
jgi:hypothetical protein